MGEARERQRAYAKGYNAARRSSWKRAERVFEIARGYKARSEETCLWRCEDCQRWTRGHAQVTVKWGYCGQDDFEHIEPRMWSDYDVGQQPRRIVTQAEFGCRNFVPKQEPSDHA